MKPDPGEFRTAPPRAQQSARLPADEAALFFGGDQPAFATGDAEFDKLFRFTSPDPEAGRGGLTPEMRRLLLDFRKKVTGEMPEHALGRFAGDLLVGTFSLERHRVTYAVSGTPSEKIARHFQMAAGILAEFGNRLRALP